MWNVFTEGFVLQASLILALGAQNLFIIDVGMKRKNHLLAATICSVCDVALILMGVLGVSALLVKSAEFKVGIGLIGTLFLLYYGVFKLIEAYKGIEPVDQKNALALSRKVVVLTTLSFTLLNPHVYIDTFFLVGGYSTRFVTQSEKIIFGLGAGFFSILWFYFLATFAARFSSVLSKQKTLRITSLITGLILGYLAFKLGKESLGM